MEIFIVKTVFIHTAQITSLKNMNDYVITTIGYYCHVEMPTEDNKILKYNHGEKSTKSFFHNLS